MTVKVIPTDMHTSSVGGSGASLVDLLWDTPAALK